MTDLLPTPIIEGFGPMSPVMARVAVRDGYRLAPGQKREGESDLEYLDRVDAEYAAFTATL